MNQERVFPSWPAAPGDAATIVMFTTHPRVATRTSSLLRRSNNSDPSDVVAIEFTWLRNDQASAANGLRCYALDDTGTWRETDLKDNMNLPTIGAAAPVTVPALSSGQEYRKSFAVSHLRGVAFEYTAGATGPTTWNGTIVVHRNALAVTI